MKAAILTEVGAPLEVAEVELDGPRAGEIRVRMAASGLCLSDWHVMSGSLPAAVPIIMGHEAAGYVEAVGDDVPGIAVGDFVVTSYASYCGECPDCQTGYNNRCEVRPRAPVRAAGSRITWKGKPVIQAADIGGFAEEMVVHHHSAVKIAPGVPAEAAALLGCGVLTGVGAAVNGAKVRPGSTVAVIGCGGVGLNIIQGARISGADRIIAIDNNPEKLTLARQFGATDGVLSGTDTAVEIRDLTSGGVDYAFEAVGHPALLRAGFDMLRKHGTLIVVGMPKMGSEMAFPVLDMMYRNIRIITSGMGDVPFQLFVPQLARWYLDGRLKLDELVSRRIGLGDIDEAYRSSAAGAVARNVITF